MEARLELTGLQRFWLKPALDGLAAAGAVRLQASRRDGAFTPPWLPIVYHRGRVSSAVYAVREGEAVAAALTGYLAEGLPQRAAEVAERLAAARRLRGVGPRPELPGPGEIAALLREAFGEAGERAAGRALDISSVKWDGTAKMVTMTIE